MANFLKSNWAIVLIAIFILISLFPPCDWNFSGSLDKDVKSKMARQLPTRSYEFIFSSSIKLHTITLRMDFKTFDVKIPLRRTIILSELILNYIISTLVILLFYLLNEKRKLRRNDWKDEKGKLNALF
jgi:hypothetical protein